MFKTYIFRIKDLSRKVWESIKSIFLLIYKHGAVPLYKANFVFYVVFVITYSMIGRVFFPLDYIAHSSIHQIVISTIILIEIYMMRFLWYTTNELEIKLSGISFNLAEIFRKLKIKQSSALNLIIPLLPAVWFVDKQIKMKYVPADIVGVYAGVYGAISFYFGLMAYYQLLLTIHAFYKISKLERNYIPFDFPDDILSIPEWIQKTRKLFLCTQYAFFTVGMMFTFEYLMLMPPNIIEFINGEIIINSKNPQGFVTGWLVIIIMIVIGFPIVNATFKYYIDKAALLVKTKAKDELDVLFNVNNNISDLNWIASYFRINEMLNKYTSIIPKEKSIYPIIATFISVSLNLIKFYDSILLKLLDITI